MRSILFFAGLLGSCICSGDVVESADPVPASAYAPLTLPSEKPPAPVELTVSDAKRHREIPILVSLPAGTEPAPVVLYSHGLGGNLQVASFLGRHWSVRGYVVVCLQHPGSDDSVWKNARGGQALLAMKRAANLENSLLRFGDVPAVINQLTTWNHESGHVLHQRLNLERLGMSGHSFGALTTQAVSGQASPLGQRQFLEPRIKAALAFSPSAPLRGPDPKAAFKSVQIPWLLMTGTRDHVQISEQTVESRLSVFPALPPGGKYELVLDNAEHSAFTDRPLPGEAEARNPQHHRSILAISTAFWDAYLREDSAAKTWLDGEGPQTILDPDDRWQRK